MDRVRVSVRGFDERVRFRFRVLGGRGGLGYNSGRVRVLEKVWVWRLLELGLLSEG